MTKAITREQLKEKLDKNESMTIVEALPRRYFDANTFEYVEGKQHWLEAQYPIDSTE